MADNTTIFFNQVAKTGTFGSVIDAVNSNFDLAKIAILNMKGKSAYEIWKDQEGNENKTLEEFLASLKESGFETQAVTTRPSASNADANTIYAVPDKSDEELEEPDIWREWICVDGVWKLLATHDGSGLSGALADIDTLKDITSSNIGSINRNRIALERKMDIHDTEEDGAYFANENGEVFMKYDSDGLDVEKVSDNLKELVKPDLSAYPKSKEVHKHIAMDTEEDGVYLTDNAGNAFMKYDEEGLDVNKVSEHFKSLVAPTTGNGSSDMMDVDESGAFFTNARGEVFMKYDSSGLDVSKISEHLKNKTKDWNIPCVKGTSALMTSSIGDINLEVPDCKYNQTISFYGKVDDGNSLGTLVIRRGLKYGKGEESDSVSKSAHIGSVEIRIDDTKVIVWGADKNGVETYLHELNISKYIIVNINNGYRDATLQIITNDPSNPNGFSQTIEFRGSRLGVKAFVEGSGAEISDCFLSWSCSDLRKPVWVFGDSYLDYWTIPAIQMGYGNAMFDGHGGRGVTETSGTYGGRKSFDLCLTFGNPKIVFWCLGANNVDTYTRIEYNQETGKNEAVGLAINTSWKDATDHVIEECDKRGIELVFYTIHNGVGKDANDKYTVLRLGTAKNEYIKASGKRYIDVYNAMTDPDKNILDADSGGEYNVDFYNGIGGNSDRVHPSTLGSWVIANYIVAHLPELKDDTKYIQE